MRQLTPPMAPMYTIQRCRKDNTLYGPVHYFHGHTATLCGKDTERGPWWILTNHHDGEATCKKCIAIDRRGKCQK